MAEKLEIASEFRCLVVLKKVLLAGFRYLRDDVKLFTYFTGKLLSANKKWDKS